MKLFNDLKRNNYQFLFILYIFLTLKNGTYNIRHYIFILPFFFYLLSYVASKYYQFFLLILNISFMNKQNVFISGKEDYRSAGKFITEEYKKSNGNSSVVTTWCGNKSFYYYYLKNNIPKNKISCINTIADFYKYEKSISNSFIIEAHVGHKLLIDPIIEGKKINCEIEKFQNINVYLCKKEK